MRHLPLLRAGQPYQSLEVAPLRDVRTGETVAEISQALTFHIARDLRDLPTRRQELAEVPAKDLVAICKKAAKLFAEADLDIGGEPQSPERYLEDLASTTGMPLVMGRRNMAKITSVLEGIEEVLGGLTRGLDLSVLDGGWGEQDGRALSYLPVTDALGGVLPNNSPGVHNLWIPAIPLKMPLVLRPGSSEPWTPYRLAQAFIEAGCPASAWHLYPSGHSGSNEVLLRTGRSLFFGDASTVEQWAATGRVQVHGPGWSKVIFGADKAADWRDHLDLMAESIAANGGRSCINCSAIWMPSHGREMAEALAERLAQIQACALDDPAARLAAFADPEIARRISEIVDQQLGDGAEDLTAKYREGDRVAEVGGCTFLLPTLIYCKDSEHPLAKAEYIFPFAAVVEMPQEEILSKIGPTLIGSILSDDAAFRRDAMVCRSIDRINLGPIPTYQISWDQPHEGNLFDHLYQQRAFQQTA